MTKRDIANAQAQEAAFRDYVRDAAGGGTGAAGELAALADLHAKGVLTDEEFARQKAKLLA
jgi:predicted nucleic acid-binding protein